MGAAPGAVVLREADGLLVRVQPDGAVGQGAGVRPVEKIGVGPHTGAILRKTDGLVFHDFAAVLAMIRVSVGS